MLESRLMRIHFLRIVALVTLLSGLLLVALSVRKTVTLVEDGEARPLSTTALTVAAFLSANQILLHEGDKLDPPAGNWLRNGEVVTIERARQVAIHADGETHVLLTTERLPANLLSMADIPLYPGDRLLAGGLHVTPDDELPRSGPYSLQVKRAFPVTLSHGSKDETFTSSAGTIGQALWEQGISLRSGDVLDPPADTPLTGPLHAELLSSRQITIRSRDGRIRIHSPAGTVGEALVDAGLPLQGFDYSLPPPEDPIPPDGRIRVVRVEESVTMNVEPLPFETEYQPVADLDIDNRKIVEPGSYGLVAERVRVRLEDSQEVSRHVEAEFISQEPQSRVIGYGTKVVPLTVDTDAGPIQYWRALNMYAVSYNPTSAGGTITASGLPLQKGVAAVDPSYIPLGTRLYVPGYGQALAADTGGGVRGRMIDLGYSDSDYVSWHHWVTVYFLWPPPDNIVWFIP